MNNHRTRNTSLWLTLAGALFLSLVTTAQADQQGYTTRVDPPQSILFTGNSLMFYNNAIYTHLRKLQVAENPANRKAFFLKSMTISGGKLSDHAGGLYQILHSRPWDVVVLQGQSREALDAELAAGFEATVKLFAKEIRSIDGEPVLFMPWAYSHKPEMTMQQSNAFRKLGNKLNIMVVPVGLAFEQAANTIPDLVLHNEDRIHPSLEGTYLAASVFYAALYEISPVDLDYDAGLDKKLARQLREAAWKTVREYYPSDK